MDYIIVQAGGKGKRLGYLTKNKPKALTPVDNLPMLFHLFRKYPDKRFIIIADYHRDVLRKYLAAFSDVKHIVVYAKGTGTCSGIRQAMELIPEDEKFMLIWSDLILSKEFEIPKEYEDNNNQACSYLGLSKSFQCRWKYENNRLEEEKSSEFGVAGLFLFPDKKILSDLPESGEFVKWLKEKEYVFKTLSLEGTREFGVLEEYEKLDVIKTRPFNQIIVENDVLTKMPIDNQGKKLAVRECAWYEKVRTLNISGIPRVYSTNPIKMELIDGENIYDCKLSTEKKREILKKLVSTLKELHNKEFINADAFSMKEAYYNKTMDRLSKVEKLVPFAREKYIVINGRKCRNVFYYCDELERRLEQIKAEKFPLIHGDCTFSNLMLRKDGQPVLIDPRGYFGFTELYGDERYDWAKLYYSIVGNYDKFNLKKFSLDIGGHSIKDNELLKNIPEGEVKLSIESNGWEEMEKDFFDYTKANEFEIKLLHAVIWLSLTTYAWQDYDSICGAFYNGLYYLEEVL